MTSKFSKFLLWIEHLLHLDKHGQLPDPPSVTGGPVVVPVLPPVVAPAPVPAPAPVSPPAAAPSPVPSPGIGNGYDANGRKLNANGSVSYQKIDNLVQSGAWPKETAEEYVSQTPYHDGTPLTDQQRLFIRFNTSSAYIHLVAGQDYPKAVDGTGVFSAYDVLPNPLGNGTQVPGELPHTVAFPSDNVINGVVEFKGFEDSDLDTFIANCERTKNFPIIKHASGPVAQ